MKIRTGFVSNSSSSSFCIYGADLSYTKKVDIKKFMDAVVKKLTELEDKTLQKYIVEGRDIHDFCELIYYLKDSKNFNLKYFNNGYDMECLGRSYKDIGDKETGLGFKNGIQEQFNFFMPDDDIICEHIETES